MSDITIKTAAHHRPIREYGLKRRLMNINHKDIGAFYLCFALLMFFVGGAMAMVIRAELFSPGVQYIEPQIFNSLSTLHALIMVFGVVMPGTVGFANWLLPMMIGAPNMALPRINALSFWILPASFLLLFMATLLPDGQATGERLLYPPVILQSQYIYPYLFIAVYMMGMSYFMTAINVITTIINKRAPGMKLLDMPMFVWTWFITAFLLVGSIPVLVGAVTLLLTDTLFGTDFLSANGNMPTQFQNVFWFFGHPEVYILILPTFGIISQVIPTFARKPLFGYVSMVVAACAIAILAYLVWLVHMFSLGSPQTGNIFVMYATMFIAVPIGIKVFNWLATLWQGEMTFETPMLFAMAFLMLFTIGGCSGLMLGMVPADFQYHHTYFVVAHFHYVLVSGAIFAMMAGAYYWLPRWTGYMYDERLGKLHFWLSAVSVNLLFFPQHFLGLAGMPRRVPDYSTQFSEWNAVSSVGGFVFGLSQLILIWVVIKCIRGKGQRVSDQVWDGAKGLEWALSSPTSYEGFKTGIVSQKP